MTFGLRARAGMFTGAVALLAGCSDMQPLGSTPEPELAAPAPAADLTRLDCEADVSTQLLSCAAPGAARTGGARAAIIGGQGTYVRLASTQGGYNAATELYTIHVTVQNLLPQAMGTRNGTTLDPAGVRVYFHNGPTASEGTGVIAVENETGTDLFMSSNQPYFQYDEVLSKNEVSPSKPWVFRVPSTVTRFTFSVYVQTALEPRLVINEVLANPGTVADEQGEWFEVYNTGLEAVDLQNWRIASAHDGFRTITSSIVVPARGYVVLGRSANTATNGGVPVAFAYGTLAMDDGNADWIELRTPTDAVHHRVNWGGVANVPNGASRGLIDPAVGDSNLMGGAWYTSWTVYGTGGDKGTPGTANGFVLAGP